MKFKDSFSNTNLDMTRLILIPSGGSDGFISKFEIDPKCFLKYAKEDLLTGEGKGEINALSNAKRAIDCQIDEVFCRFGINYQKIPTAIESFVGFYEFQDDISYKLKIIQALNLAPGFIIGKARTLRNKLEHFYKVPTKNEVKDAIDIADLFIRTVDGIFRSQINEFYITDQTNFIEDYDFTNGYAIEFDPEKRILNINEHINGKRTRKVSMTINDPEFYGFIRLMNSINDEFELTESFKVIGKLINHPTPKKYIKVEQY